MAIVKNQDLPLEDIEDQVDPPIPFVDTYRRVLSEGIDHPKLPAGEEVVTFSKKESRPASSSGSPFSKPAGREAWRQRFKECLNCWGVQVDTDEEIDPCQSAGSRKYVKPWEYVAGARNTVFHQFMKECLNWAVGFPDEKFPKCEDLEVSADSNEFCPNGQIFFTATNGNDVVIVGVDCGTIVDTMVWQAPATWAECPDEVKIYFDDEDGRKGCVSLHKMSEEECCCAINPEVEIHYDSLIMGCSEIQTLSLNPDAVGCAPYAWSIEGGGELSSYEGESVDYTAPETNPGCASNPSITVTDACGNTSTVHLAINCYPGDDAALRVTNYQKSSPDPGCIFTWCYPSGSAYTCLFGKIKKNYNCSGQYINIYSDQVITPPCANPTDPCADPCSYFPGPVINIWGDCASIEESEGCGYILDV